MRSAMLTRLSERCVKGGVSYGSARNDRINLKEGAEKCYSKILHTTRKIDVIGLCNYSALKVCRCLWNDTF